MEYSDIYDSRHKRTGRQMVRGEAIRENDYIQASAAVVICDGYILVTRRHPDKKNPFVDKKSTFTRGNAGN